MSTQIWRASNNLGYLLYLTVGMNVRLAAQQNVAAKKVALFEQATEIVDLLADQVNCLNKWKAILMIDFVFYEHSFQVFIWTELSYIIRIETAEKFQPTSWDSLGAKLVD